VGQVLLLRCVGPLNPVLHDKSVKLKNISVFECCFSLIVVTIRNDNIVNYIRCLAEMDAVDVNELDDES
jgi:hypothetical protein